MPIPKFRKHIVATFDNSLFGGDINTLSTVGDINGDGRPDLVVSGRSGQMAWFENPGQLGAWKMHLVDHVKHQECGGSLATLTGSRKLDIINGSDWQGHDISWWQNPGGSGLWQRRVIYHTGKGQFHDTIIGDVGDGRLSLVFDNQEGGTAIYKVPIPADPTVSPWPNVEVIASGMKEDNPTSSWNPEKWQPEEGLAIGDVDNDGINEVVAGTHWFKLTPSGWVGHKFASGYITNKIAIGDVDGDGKNEIVLSEGDPVIYGKKQGGKLGWFKPGEDILSLWIEHVVDDGLLEAHSLVLADLCGIGRLDIFCAEIGAVGADDLYILRPPFLAIYENLGNGKFQRHVIDEGTGTHEAVLVDAFNTGRLDIIGKPLHGPEKWDLHVWENLGF
jgi:hypothetical protein